MTTLPSWRASNPDGFADVVVTAAQQLGVRPLAVEKDYWACEALRAITVAHTGEVVFKGGTSLEKLRIIRRFSEDLDLLVIGGHGSNRAAERALKSMIAAAADATGGQASGGHSGGRPGSFHRSAYLAPPRVFGGAECDRRRRHHLGRTRPVRWAESAPCSAGHLAAVPPTRRRRFRHLGLGRLDLVRRRCPSSRAHPHRETATGEQLRQRPNRPRWSTRLATHRSPVLRPVGTPSATKRF